MLINIKLNKSVNKLCQLASIETVIFWDKKKVILCYRIINQLLICFSLLSVYQFNEKWNDCRERSLFDDPNGQLNHTFITHSPHSNIDRFIGGFHECPYGASSGQQHCLICRN